MEIYSIMRVLAESEDGTDVAKAGFFADYMWIVGIVLAVVGLALVYFGIKVGKGYRFMPEQTETTVVEDDNPSVNAEIVDRRTTEIPDYSHNGSGTIVFKEMLIRYDVEGQICEEWINDSGEYTDTVPIKYNPTHPEEFHVYEGEENFEGIPDENGDLAGNEDDEAGEPAEAGSSSVKYTLIGIGVILLGVGIFVLIDGLTK
ncbi:MAG: hypothetical protein IKP47_05105 [Ruminococcus sp.]|nr:hypothetical protein [Ruminococcus sp.]